MSKHFGGSVNTSKKREFGHAEIKLKNSKLFQTIKIESLNVWMSHGDKVTKLPKGFKIVASSKNSPIAAFENNSIKKYGLQFHPEVTHTEKGAQILKTFVREICGCQAKWRPKNIVEKLVDDIKNK